MKKKILISFLLLLFTFPALSQDKASDLKKLFKVMNSEKMMDDMMESMIPMLKEQAKQEIQGKDAQEKFDKYIAYMMNEVKAMTKKLVNEEMVGIYDKHFTHQEIKDLVAFYQSSTGQKMLQKTPELTKDLMYVMMSKYLPEFQKNLKKKLEELK